jgi:hypothetical protein
MIARAALITCLALAVSSTPGRGGSFVGIAVCDVLSGCILGSPKIDHPQCDIDPETSDCKVTPFGITHPLGYTGNETLLQLKICVEPEDAKLEPAVLRAISLWESLTPSSGNCEGCVTWEEEAATYGVRFAYPTVLHELGHCAMGLDHVDRLWDVNADGNFENTSFTLSAEAILTAGALDPGTDGVRGSKDDFHLGLGGGGQPAESVSWFRRADNDPFIVDPATDIDSASYSRSLSKLPGPEHRWGASANRVVGDLLGYTDSQAVMYAGIGRNQFYSTLGADDVNMVKMGMTGADLAANSPDDYTIDLVYIGDCSTAHDIRVYVGETFGGGVAECVLKRINYSFDPGNPLLARHFSVVRAVPATPLEVILDENIPWVFEDPATVIFADGFESGDAGAWSAVFPLDQSNKGP